MVRRVLFIGVVASVNRVESVQPRAQHGCDAQQDRGVRQGDVPGSLQPVGKALDGVQRLGLERGTSLHDLPPNATVVASVIDWSPRKNEKR